MPDRRALVLDTSVVLNLLASGDPVRLLEALDADCYVTPQVIAEVTREPALPHETCTLADLLHLKALHRQPVAGAVLDTFIQLAGAAPPDGLDDGEASTIAAAEELDCAALIDERKATRIALFRRPQSSVLCSVDVFHAAQSTAAASDQDLAALLYRSLKYARMRVPFEHGRWVVSVIGSERALDCPSLGAVLRSLKPAR